MTSPPPADESARQELRARARVGTLLGKKWHLDELLGTGGMAAVYAATHRNGSRAAIKMLHPEHCAQVDLLERFFEEGYAANKVEHPGAVSVLDDGYAEDGAPFLVMELLQGCPLDARFERGGVMSPAEALNIADQLLDVLAAAHERGVVHRDIKPANVFVARDGKVKVLDFGIARLQAPRRQRTTQAGYAMGTPAFMPPEQARGHQDKIDGRTDVWAVGATLYWLLSGRFVHEAATANEELLAAMTVPARSVTEVAPHVPRPLADLIDRALAFDPDARFGNARSMQMAVRVASLELKRLETATLPPTPPASLPPGLSTAHTVPALVEGSVDSTPASIGPSTTSRTSGLSFRSTSRWRRVGRYVGAVALASGIVAVASYAGLSRDTDNPTVSAGSPERNPANTSVTPPQKPLSEHPPVESPRVPPADSVLAAEQGARKQGDTSEAAVAPVAAAGAPSVETTENKAPAKPARRSQAKPPRSAVVLRSPSPNALKNATPGGEPKPEGSEPAQAEPAPARDPLGRRN